MNKQVNCSFERGAGTCFQDGTHKIYLRVFIFLCKLEKIPVFSPWAFKES